MGMGFNHNIVVYGKTFHIQTEEVIQKNLIIIYTQIFVDGTVFWSKRHKYRSYSQSELKKSHENGFKLLKSLIYKNHVISPHHIKEPFCSLKEKIGDALVSGDLFHEKYQISLTGLNNNDSAKKIFRRSYNNACNESQPLPLMISVTQQRSILIDQIDDTHLIYALLLNYPLEALSKTEFQSQFSKLLYQKIQMTL